MEEWVDIHGFNGLYQISNNGRIRRIGTKTCIFKPKYLHGFHYVRLKENGRRIVYCIERMLPEYFSDKYQMVNRYSANSNDELWMDINGYEGLYQVSNRGRVRSVTHTITMNNGRERTIYGKELVLHEGGNNQYLQAHLHKDGNVQNRLVHRMVAELFIGEIPDGYEINHKNANVQDNRVENLEIVTRKENMAHAVRNNLVQCGEEHHSAKLTNEDAIMIRKLYRKGDISQTELGKMFGVSQNVIFKIVNYETYLVK